MTESVWAHFTGGPHHGKTMRVPNHPRIQLPELRAFAVVAVDTAGLFPDLTSCSTYDRAWPRKRKLIVIEDSPAIPAGTVVDELPAVKLGEAIIYEHVA